MSSWNPNPKFGNCRQLLYRVPLNFPIGPKSSRSEESQRYHLSKTSLRIDTVVVALDIPFADYFRVEGQWNVQSKEESGGGGCKVTIKVAVPFSKNTLFKCTLLVSFYF